MKKYLVFILFIAFNFSSCGIFDGSEIRGSSIHFKRPNLITTPIQGSDEHRINDLWITLGNKDLGVWPVDRTVPFLPLSDPTEITIFPGVRVNGDFTSSINYPFYEGITFEKSFVEGEVDTMTLDFRYTDLTVFSFVEDFEGLHLFTNDEDDDMESVVEIEEVDGSNVAVLRVMPDHEIVDVSTSTTYGDIIGTNNSVFLELEYKSETTFAVGLVTVAANGEELYKPFIFLKEKADWNKVYLNLTTEVLDPDIISYRVRFTLQSSTATAEEAIYLDNIKLVHF